MADRGDVIIRGAEATGVGFNGGVAPCGAGAACGIGAADAGALMAGTGAAVSGPICPLAVLWPCCWWATRAVNTPSRATALATTTRRNLFDCVQ